MVVIQTQIDPYIECDADLIPLNIWNKKKKGKDRGKTPLYNNWSKRDKDTTGALAKAKKDFNLGYRLGPTDLVIDVDPRNFPDGRDVLAELVDYLEMGDLCDVYPTVVTGSGGYHFYTTVPEGLCLRETHDKFPGIEFKTQGRQVVTAGSKHPNGEYYLWDEFSPALHDRTETPTILKNLLKRETVVRNQGEAGEFSGEQVARLLEQLPVEDFQDHEKWFGVMCACHHATNGTGLYEFLEWSLGDLDYDQDEQLIKYRWDTIGESKTTYTINTLYKHVLTYGGDTAVVKAEEDFKDLESEEKEDLDDDFDDVLSDGELKESFNPGVALTLARGLTPEYSDEDLVKAIRAALQAGTIEQVKCFKAITATTKLAKADLNEIIKQIKEQIQQDMGRMLAEKTLEIKFFKGKGLVFTNSSMFWAYNGKFWEPITKQYVGRMVTVVLDKLRKKTEIKVKENALVTEAVSILERITAARKDILRLTEKPYPIINCKNGELWIKDDGTSELKPHTYKSYLTQCIDVEFTPGAKSPLFDKSIRKTFSHFEDCEDIVRHFEEYMGYVLHPDKRPAHWWLFKGPGGDGKSTLLKILSAILGDSVKSDTVERFRDDKHATAELIGKLLMYDDDLDRNMLLPDGLLKKLSEDGRINANPKGERGFDFYRICTVTMLSNGFPRTRDVTRGFRRRAMVIPFNNAFHEGEAILDLPDQIIKKELAGVMNRALEGLVRLRARGSFLEPDTCVRAKAEWLSESNTVAGFLNERIIVTGNDKDTISLNDMFMEFQNYCSSYNISKIMSKQAFRTNLTDMDIQFRNSSKNVRKFVGVKLAEEVSDLAEEFSDLEDVNSQTSSELSDFEEEL